MMKNKRLLMDNLGETHEAFALNGSLSSENKFIWNNNVKKIEILYLKEEKNVHKINSLKSRYSKIDFKEWKLYTLSSKRKVTNADLKVRANLYKKGLLTLTVDGVQIKEIFVNKSSETRRSKFIRETDKLITKIEKLQNAVTDSKFTKAKSAGKETTKQKIIQDAKEAVKDVVILLENVIKTYLEDSKIVSEGKAVVYENNSGNKAVFKNLLIEYKEKNKSFKEAAKEKAESFKPATKNKNLLFNFKSAIRKDVYKLELAKQEVEFLGNLSKYNWEFKYKYEIAKELIETMPNIIGVKQKNASLLFKAKSKISTNKNENISEELKIEIKVAKEKASNQLKEEYTKLKISGASRNGLKTKKSEIKHNLKSEVRSIKLKNKLFMAKTDYRSLLAELSQKIAYEEKILKSNLQEIRKKTPIEISKSKYWISIVLGVLVPGLNSLINKQWIKSIFQLAGTVLFAFILAWTLGAFPSKSGNGVIGLTHFGAVNGSLANGNDSRFYVVMGSIGIIFLVAAAMFWLISALNTINVANLSKAGVRYSNWRDQKRLLKTAGLPYLLSAPALIFILFIVVLPLLATLLLSFTNFNQRVFDPTLGKNVILNGTTHPFTWVGGQQFTYITKVVGSDFVSVLEWTILWTIFATFLTMFLGTLLAILVNQNRIKGKTFFRIVYILPWAIPAFLTILFFSIFFGVDGTFNHIIGEKMFGRAINWKTEVTHEKVLLIFIQGWLGQSYMFLLVTGMLQSIPKSLYEAARVDGSRPLQQFRTITMPIIVMQIAPLLIGQFTFNFNNFGIIYLFNGGGPLIPGHSAGETDIFLSWVFRMVNDGVFAKPGAGAALSLLVSIFVVTPSAFLFFRSKSFRGGNF